MRLSQRDIDTIRMSADEVFGSGVVVRLFGSRLDDERDGGDLDIHLDLLNRPTDLEARASELWWQLSNALDVPKIDILVHANGTVDRPIDRWARLTGQSLRDVDQERRVDVTWSDQMTQTVMEMLAENLAAARAVGGRLQETHDLLVPAFPIAVDQLQPAPLIQRLAYDGMLRQVQNLIDLLGRRLFRSLYMIESRELAPKLEKVWAFAVEIHLVEAEDWKSLVTLRNSLAHDYTAVKSKQAATLNDCFKRIPLILAILERTLLYVHSRFPELLNDLPTE